MKRSKGSDIPLSKVIAGYKLAAEARHLSSNTLRDYTTTFYRFQDFLDDDLPISQITPYRQAPGVLALGAVCNRWFIPAGWVFRWSSSRCYWPASLWIQPVLLCH
jgi:hypothetical protein